MIRSILNLIFFFGINSAITKIIYIISEDFKPSFFCIEDIIKYPALHLSLTMDIV